MSRRVNLVKWTNRMGAFKTADIVIENL